MNAGTPSTSTPVGGRTRGRAGPVPRLSADAIAQAVIDVGFENASLVAVAQHLSVGHGALYRYIGDRDGMMRSALERLTASYPWPALVDDWETTLWNEARAWWALCDDHAGFVATLASTPGLPPAMGARSLAVAVHLTASGVGNYDALVVTDFAVGLVHNVFHWASQRQAILDQALSMSPEDAAQRVAGVPRDMVAALADAMAGDAWSWYAAKLEFVIEGVRSRLDAPSA